MKKEYRLKSSKSFEYMHKHGKSIANNTLVLIYIPTKYNLKVGFSVSKKLGKAVVRNKVKRRLREGFRLMIPYLDNKHNYIFIARQDAQTKNYHELLSSMKNLVLRAGLVKDKNSLNDIK